jgi:hypothetical protein
VTLLAAPSDSSLTHRECLPQMGEITTIVVIYPGHACVKIVYMGVKDTHLQDGHNPLNITPGAPCAVL